jgi:cytochrome c
MNGARMKTLAISVALCGLIGASLAQAEINEAAAQALLKKSKCMSCHSVDKKKDGPSYQEVAGTYREDPEAEAKLTAHVTSSPMIEVDGEEEEHPALDSTDGNAIRNVVRWILSH